MDINTLIINNSEFLSYCQIKSSKNSKVGVLFLGGLKSDMNGTKALHLQNFCRKHDLDFTKFDYYGHGKSSGKFLDGTIEKWLENSQNVMDLLINKKQIVIGSSMGGWIMILLALLRAEKIKALIGIAAAPDFTEDFLKDEHAVSANGESIIIKKGQDYEMEVSQKLIKNAKQYLVLKQKMINIDKPTILFHGMKDAIVDYQSSINLATLLKSDNVSVRLFKNADHSFSSPENLAEIENAIKSFL